jgi:type 1 fimbriae regulatory protein FimB/type 1 fimbriae regulatory protein FimE
LGFRATSINGGAERVSPNMLRQGCGFALANKGHDTRALQAYLGHHNIQHTVPTRSFCRIGSKDFSR